MLVLQIDIDIEPTDKVRFIMSHDSRVTISQPSGGENKGESRRERRNSTSSTKVCYIKYYMICFIFLVRLIFSGKQM